MSNDFDFCGTFNRKEMVLSIARAAAHVLKNRESLDVVGLSCQVWLSSPSCRKHPQVPGEGRRNVLLSLPVLG